MLQNKYIRALKGLILFSAISHLVLLLGYALFSRDIVYLNYFNILDIDLLFPEVIYGFLSQILSCLSIVSIYFIIFYLQKK